MPGQPGLPTLQKELIDRLEVVIADASYSGGYAVTYTELQWCESSVTCWDVPGAQLHSANLSASGTSPAGLAVGVTAYDPATKVVTFLKPFQASTYLFRTRAWSPLGSSVWSGNLQVVNSLRGLGAPPVQGVGFVENPSTPSGSTAPSACSVNASCHQVTWIASHTQATEQQLSQFKYIVTLTCRYVNASAVGGASVLIRSS